MLKLYTLAFREGRVYGSPERIISMGSYNRVSVFKTYGANRESLLAKMGTDTRFPT